MRLLNIVSLVMAVFVVGGCAHQPVLRPVREFSQVRVSFPPLKLAANEFIQAVEVEVRCGHIVSIQHLPFDWDLKVEWDSTSYEKLSARADHFSAGLASAYKLADFITVRDAGDGCLSIKANLVTDRAGSSNGETRKYEFSQAQLILKRNSN